MTAERTTAERKAWRLVTEAAREAYTGLSDLDRAYIAEEDRADADAEREREG